MKITKTRITIEDTDKLTAHHGYKTANFATAFMDSIPVEDTNLECYLQKHGMRLDNHELFVFDQITLKYVNNRVLVGKTENVYAGGWNGTRGDYLYRNR